MKSPAPSGHRWRKVLATPVSQLLRGRITGAQCPLERLNTSSLPNSVVEAIRAITTRLSGRCRLKAARQLVKSCEMALLEGRVESQLVEHLSEPKSIAPLIRLTRNAGWVLDSSLPPSLWSTVNTLVGQSRVRNSTTYRIFQRERVVAGVCGPYR